MTPTAATIQIVAAPNVMPSTPLLPAAAERAIAIVEHMSVCFQAGLFLPKVTAATADASS